MAVHFTLLFIAIAIWFVRQEKAELGDVRELLTGSRWYWVLAGIVLTCIYVVLQGIMYVFSFAAAHCRINIGMAIRLFLKRNFIRVFLPAGGISSLAFFTGPIRQKGINESQIHFASGIYGFVGILTVVLVAILAFFYALLDNSVGAGEWYALASVLLLTLLFVFIYHSVMLQSAVYRIILAIHP